MNRSDRVHGGAEGADFLSPPSQRDSRKGVRDSCTPCTLSHPDVLLEAAPATPVLFVKSASQRAQAVRSGPGCREFPRASTFSHVRPCRNPPILRRGARRSFLVEPRKVSACDSGSSRERFRYGREGVHGG